MIAFIEQLECEKSVLFGLIVFHLVLTSITFFTRRSCNFQAILFFCLLTLVYFTQEIIKKNFITWKLFHKKSSDENQLLFSVIYSVPILLNCMLIIGNWLWQSAQLMILLKREQLHLNSKKKLK